MKRNLRLIKPKEYNSPDVRKKLYNAVDCVANATSPAIGYAFVSFHADKSFQAYWDLDKTTLNPMDLPDMVRARLAAKVINSME